ncbi:MAG: hypothetical protein COS99_08170 [Candidatus Omnitrophica bacterium CG07_land_8_20_14_0_80_42_15]|uniref:histidine kinase n=1 Tax=Candidatus Aquitaenariimonas noxiae TaxID=1974741 RepID=A0A2J0KQH0_9BACT|nr:MAG: hypothetical protein COS99_08170 [Candidatus Omnitrophica bacterium CG07_land_8_20_14_0_80_42_15]
MHIKSRRKVALVAVGVLLLTVRLTSIFVYQKVQIMPADLFVALAIVLLFLFWLDSMEEKYNILRLYGEKEKLHEIKSKAAFTISNELATPITIIKGYVNLITDKSLGPLTEEQKTALDVMVKYCNRLEEIKSDLSKIYLDIPSGFDKRLQPSSIEVIIRSTAGDIMSFIKKRNQEIIVDIERDIPHVMMDRNSMRQVLVNLLLNAIRFTPDKGRITIRAKDEEDNIRVEVEDNGIGIPKDELGSIFESFYGIGDIDKHSSGNIEFKSSGIGLGLAIAKNIIDAHKGKIWVLSEKGKFSNFIFTLPKNM